MDCRISVNLEMDWRGSTKELEQLAASQTGRQPNRNKDRLSYTHGHYQVDLRWWYGSEQMLPHDTDFDSALYEGIWTFDQGTTLTRSGVQSWVKARPECYSDQSAQRRAENYLVYNILNCSETDPLSHGALYVNVMWTPPPGW